MPAVHYNNTGSVRVRVTVRYEQFFAYSSSFSPWKTAKTDARKFRRQ